MDCDSMLHGLEQAGFGPQLETVLCERLSSHSHGDFDRWRQAVCDLPVVPDTRTELDTAVVLTEGLDVDAKLRERIRDRLMQLVPWRKGPFRLHGIDLDTEWRSDLKWDRLADAITPLQNRRILDVGCGNGYYAFRMIGAGASQVVGIDPTVLYVMQFIALNHFLGVPDIHVLPLRLSELPESVRRFDTTFSMGVLYHQREPAKHLAELRATLEHGGELVLETLIYPGDENEVHIPSGRYARMRNVWALPSHTALRGWLEEAGFVDFRLVDTTATTTDEQRTTDWMPFESLAEALDPDDAARTVEGLPAPLRAVVTCLAP